MTNPSIAIQTLLLSIALSILWGIYFLHTLREYIAVQHLKGRRRQDVFVAFRRMLAGWCLFILPFSVVFRLILVELDVGDQVIGQILFFTLAGFNFVGAVFAVVSLKLD